MRPFLAVDGPRRLYFTRSVLMRCHALALWKSRCRAQHNIISECRVLFLVRCFLANASIPRVMPLGTAGTIDSVNSLRPSWPSVQNLFVLLCSHPLRTRLGSACHAYGTDLFGIPFQALRARLRSFGPYGTRFNPGPFLSDSHATGTIWFGVFGDPGVLGVSIPCATLPE